MVSKMIEFRNITKIYQDTGQTVLENISFQLERGGFLFLTGKSGSGKSTIIKLILKEIEPTTGEIWVNGNCLSKMSKKEIPYYRQNIGVVFQDFRLLPDRSVYQNVALAQIIVGIPRHKIERKVSAILSMMGMADKFRAYPSELSGGEQQKVALARAIVNQPSLLLADEPTGNLDDESANEIMQLLYMLHQNQTTVLVATHQRHFMKEQVFVQEQSLGNL